MTFRIRHFWYAAAVRFGIGLFVIAILVAIGLESVMAKTPRGMAWVVVGGGGVVLLLVILRLRNYKRILENEETSWNRSWLECCRESRHVFYDGTALFQVPKEWKLEKESGQRLTVQTLGEIYRALPRGPAVYFPELIDDGRVVCDEQCTTHQTENRCGLSEEAARCVVFLMLIKAVEKLEWGNMTIAKVPIFKAVSWEEICYIEEALFIIGQVSCATSIKGNGLAWQIHIACTVIQMLGAVTISVSVVERCLVFNKTTSGEYTPYYGLFSPYCPPALFVGAEQQAINSSLKSDVRKPWLLLPYLVISEIHPAFGTDFPIQCGASAEWPRVHKLMAAGDFLGYSALQRRAFLDRCRERVKTALISADANLNDVSRNMF